MPWVPSRPVSLISRREAVSTLFDLGYKIPRYPQYAEGTDHHMEICTAVGEGHLEVAKLLLEKKASLEAKCYPSTQSGGANLMHLAAYSGNGEMIRFLAEKGLDVDASAGHVRFFNMHQVNLTPLHRAVSQGHCEAVKTLLELKANPNVEKRSFEYQSGKKGITPLYLSIKGDTEIVRALLEAKAATNTIVSIQNSRTSQKFITPVFEAVEMRRMDVAQMLVQARASLNVRAGILENGKSTRYRLSSIMPREDYERLEDCTGTRSCTIS
mmetsp:Transcript_4837/g.8744  ORF Transcript_4837/g.8744 Transcript_4837/m.8744 type:complete len:269 (-) Transcript_4837:218-1024(-)